MELERIPERVTDLLGPIREIGAVVEIVKYDDRSVPPTLQVTIDRASGTESLNLDEIGEVSRLISSLLDTQEDLIDSEYNLEVSTPGAESNLTKRRHFERNIGRTVRIKLRDGSKFEGVLESADGEGFVVALDTGVRRVDYSVVLRARPRVQFS